VHNLVLYCKTHIEDFDSFRRLQDSILKHNADNIPVYVSVNPNQVELFKELVSDNYILLDDREIYTPSINLDGWRYQQIIKSNFYKLGVCNNYIWIDSDGFFIKDFHITDFMYTDDIPYTVMHESKELLESLVVQGNPPQLSYYPFQEVLRSIFKTHGPRYDWGPTPVVWSAGLLHHFHEEFLAANNLTTETFLQMCESMGNCNYHEIVAYGEYLWFSNLIPMVPRQPYFKVYHHKEQWERDIQSNIGVEQLRHNYLGIVMQSNWSNYEYNN